MASIGANIRAERARMGLTQVELAQKVGVHRETLAFWEREKTKPNGAQIILLAEALGVQDMNVLIEV